MQTRDITADIVQYVAGKLMASSTIDTYIKSKSNNQYGLKLYRVAPGDVPAIYVTYDITSVPTQLIGNLVKPLQRLRFAMEICSKIDDTMGFKIKSLIENELSLENVNQYTNPSDNTKSTIYTPIEIDMFTDDKVQSGAVQYKLHYIFDIEGTPE
jgi:hypothetical protein